MQPRTFPTPAGLHVDLRIPAGSIEVKASETDETRLGIRGERDPDDFRIEFDDTGAGARLTVEYREKGKLFGWRGTDLRVDLTVPVGTDVAASTGSADLEVVGSVGSLRFKSGSGDCRFGAVDGDVTVNTASGDVSGGSVDGAVSAHTASGDVRIGPIGGDVVARSASGDISLGSAADLQVTTVSGDVDVATLRSGSATVRSVSGDIEIGVARGARVFLDLMSTSGSTVSELDMWAGDGNAAETGVDLEIRAATVSGDIRVVR